MNRYSVTLCLIVEADTAEEALHRFYEEILEDGFTGKSIDIEVELNDD